MSHIFICNVVLGLGLAATAHQAFQFEAATVKKTPPFDNRQGTVSGGSCRGIDSSASVSGLFEIPLGRCIFKNASVGQMIAATFPVQSSIQSVSQLVRGGPDWLWDAFDLEGKAENPSTVRQDQLLQMLRAFLIDRFKLQYHLEHKTVPGYRLVIAKAGHKLKPGTGPLSGIRNARGSKSASNASIALLARSLSRDLGPVIDRTGLEGSYAFELSGDASVFTILEEQLGLRLEPERVTLDFIVIDSAEKPPAGLN